MNKEILILSALTVTSFYANKSVLLYDIKEYLNLSLKGKPDFIFLTHMFLAHALPVATLIYAINLFYL